jgi:hypothetical protein
MYSVNISAGTGLALVSAASYPFSARSENNQPSQAMKKFDEIRTLLESKYGAAEVEKLAASESDSNKSQDRIRAH